MMMIGLGVLLLLGAGTVLVGPWLRADDKTTGDRIAPTSEQTASTTGQHDPTGSVDDATRRVMVNGASMLLPADPYTIAPDPITIDGVFDVYFLAEAVVHPRTASTPGWGAMVGLAHLDPALEESGSGALEMITRHVFGSYPTTLAEVTPTPVTVHGRSALRITATVHYTVKGLPSTHDDVTAIVVELADDSTVVAMASVPDDAPPQLRKAALASLTTLTVG